MANRSSERELSLRLPALLSALLVAFTIEFDNEFEHRMPHRTTRHGRTEGAGPRPWLISMAMWVHVMRLVPEEGISARDLVRRSQLTPKSMKVLVKRVGRWWGYLELEPDPDGRVSPPASEWLVRPTKAGREAQRIWSLLTDEIEARWTDRFGKKAVGDLRAALVDVVGRLDVDPPDYPLGEPRLPPRQRTEGDARLPLTALLSKVLLALAIDFDDHSDLSLEIYTAGVGSRLPICANVLRLIGDNGVAVARIPELSGVDKMAIDNWVRILDKCGYIEVATVPGGRRRVAHPGTRRRDAWRRLYLRPCGHHLRPWAGGAPRCHGWSPCYRRAFLTKSSVPWPTSNRSPPCQLPRRWRRTASGPSAVPRAAECHRSAWWKRTSPRSW